LKVKYDEPLSTFAFNDNLRPYTQAEVFDLLAANYVEAWPYHYIFSSTSA